MGCHCTTYVNCKVRKDSIPEATSRLDALKAQVENSGNLYHEVEFNPETGDLYFYYTGETAYSTHTDIDETLKSLGVFLVEAAEAHSICDENDENCNYIIGPDEMAITRKSLAVELWDAKHALARAMAHAEKLGETKRLKNANDILDEMIAEGKAA